MDTVNLGLRGLALAALLAPAVSLWSATEGGLDFEAPLSLSVGRSALGLAAVDLDGDTLLDLVSGDGELRALKVFLKEVRGYSSLPAAPAGGLPVKIAAGDVDGDGDQDLLVAHASEGVHVVWNDGGGSLRVAERTSYHLDVPALVAVDVDGDADADLVLASPRQDSLVFLRSDGGGAISEPEMVPVGPGPAAVDAADIDGDGDLDIVCGTVVFSPARGEVWLARNTGNGSFDAATKVHDGGSPVSLEAVDLNGDGAPDIAHVDGASGHDSVHLLSNDGSGAFPLARTVRVDPGPLRLAAGDLDGDADNDLALIHYEPGHVAVIDNDGHGAFAAGNELPLGSELRELVAGDLHGLGRVDLAVSRSHRGNGGTIAVLRAEPGGSFRAAAELRTGVPGTEVAAAADLNGDGLLDVAASAHGLVVTYLGTEEGQLARGPRIQAVGDTFFVTAADLDGDGDQDLITLNPQANSPLSRAAGLLKNDGSGRFAPPLPVPLREEPVALFVTDIDGRAGPDLVVGTWRARGLELFRNTGVGEFVEGPRMALQDEPVSVTGGDLDGDADVDLVVSIESDLFGPVSTLVLENQEGGSFDPPARETAGGLAAFVGDMDQDGDLDVVTSGSILLENPGDGAFQHHEPLRAAPVGSFVTGGDFDGDRALDLAFAHWDADEIAVYRNDRNASFAPPLGLATTTRPIFLVAADFDGDGLPDLLAAHEDLDLLLLLRNRSSIPPLPSFHRGDSNADGRLDVSDGIHVLNFLYLGGPEPPCKDAADATDDGLLDCSDAVFIFGYLFLGTPVPSAPGPPGAPCGSDADAGALGCGGYPACSGS